MDLASEFLEHSRRYLANEYRIKLRAAVETLPPDALWIRANDASNSVANLLLHLTGNVQQWIVSGLGGAPDTRHRAAEFEARSGADATALLSALDKVLDDADAALAKLTPADLTSVRTIQGREMTVFDAIYHVVEHFSGHLGQIVLIAKAHTPGAVRFYEDAGGLARPIWETERATPLAAQKHEFTQGLFGWITHTDLASADPGATRAWCASVLGWTFRPPFSTPSGDIHLFAYSAKGGGAVRPISPPEIPGSIPYIHVESAQTAFNRALAAGAEEMMPPTRVMEGVTIAIVRAPGGVPIGLSGP